MKNINNWTKELNVLIFVLVFLLSVAVTGCSVGKQDITEYVQMMGSYNYGSTTQSLCQGFGGEYSDGTCLVDHNSCLKFAERWNNQAALWTGRPLRCN
ncbi:hypothetical protein FACS1894125_5820 [Actinomycetota bacterium]|nr:hypothetical protein FACS1894125_5820 [Actinomycetota bacterium]